ncbi:MAG: hypothetical protein JNM18_14865 [Planctomycetaceae bacterium]|nr:hypothetical protein [Planctomycetaceae bacterium]
MNRFILSLVGWGLLSLAASPLWAARPADTLLPASTQAFVSVANYAELEAAFNRTSFGRLLNDPIMRPFRDDLQRQWNEKGSQLKDAIGVSLQDLETLATGEIGVALVKNGQGLARTAAIVDVTQNLPGAQELLAKVDAHLVQKRGAMRRDLNHQGIALRVYDVPAAGPGKQPTQGVYFFIEGQLGITNDLTVAQDVINVATGQQPDTLAKVVGYQACMERSAKALQLPPQLAFWADPMGTATTIEASNAKRSKKGQNLLKILRNEGFDAVQGLGGHINFHVADQVANYGVLYRIAVHAPGPYKRAMRMLVLPNGGDMTPPAFVSRQIGGYTAFNLDAINAFDNFGTLFDAMFGEGESIWGDVLDSLKNDPNGPRVDLRNDIIAHLQNHGVVLTDNTQPVGPHSQRRMFAVQAKDPTALAAAVDRLMRNDKSVKTHEVQGMRVYEIVPEAPDDLPDVNVNNLSSKKPKAEPPPHGGVAVAHGWLIVSSHWDFVRQVIERPNAATPLATHSDYLAVTKALKQLLPSVPTSIEGFTDDNEVYLTTYEMFRQGRLSESSVPLAKALNGLLNDPEQGKTWKQLDGTKLPEFGAIRKYLGIGGGNLTSEPTGWFHLGFSIDPDAPQAEAANKNAALPQR